MWRSPILHPTISVIHCRVATPLFQRLSYNCGTSHQITYKFTASFCERHLWLWILRLWGLSFVNGHGSHVGAARKPNYMDEVTSFPELRGGHEFLLVSTSALHVDGQQKCNDICISEATWDLLTTGVKLRANHLLLLKRVWFGCFAAKGHSEKKMNTA